MWTRAEYCGKSIQINHLNLKVTTVSYRWNVVIKAENPLICLVFILIPTGDTGEQDSCRSKQILMNAGQEKGQENPLVLDGWY